MKGNLLLPLALLGAIPTQALPLQARDIPQFSTSLLNNSGLQNATLSLSMGGSAICVAGNVPVSVSATNVDFDFGDLSNQTVVTNTAVEIVQVNTTFVNQAIKGNATISSTFNINAKLCFPVNSNNTQSSTIQFLTHGIAFDKAYWDFIEGYSYVDAAAAAGYATFFYDRLGTGQSDHPDPISVVQAPLHVEIAHSLIQSLRSGAFNNGQNYSRIVGVGHSLGSIITEAITANYPADLDAAVLTGFSTDTASQGLTLVGFNPAIANQNQPLRFPDLPNGYLVTDTSISNQLTFLRAPNFDPEGKRRFCKTSLYKTDTLRSSRTSRCRQTNLHFRRIPHARRCSETCYLLHRSSRCCER